MFNTCLLQGGDGVVSRRLEDVICGLSGENAYNIDDIDCNKPFVLQQDDMNPVLGVGPTSKAAATLFTLLHLTHAQFLGPDSGNVGEYTHLSVRDHV